MARGSPKVAPNRLRLVTDPQEGWRQWLSCRMLAPSMKDAMTNSDLTADDRRTIDKTLRVFDVLRAVDPKMTIGAAVAFLQVALNEEQAVGELESEGTGRSSTSRYGKYLGDGTNRAGKPGLGLLTKRRPNEDHRVRLLSLTPKGEMLVTWLHNVVSR